MKIELLHKYKSISPFEPVDLPPFAVIVGLNGTGKSQLLEAIQHQIVNCDLLADSDGPQGTEGHPGVVKLTNSSLTLHSEMFDSANSRGTRLSEEVFNAHRNTVFQRIPTGLVSTFKGVLPGNEILSDIFGLSREKLLLGEGGTPLEDHVLRQRTQALDQLNQLLSESFFIQGHQAAQQAIKRFISHNDTEARLITYEEAANFGSWGDHALFNAQLPMLFAGYRTQRNANKRLSAHKDRPANANWLDQEQFTKEFGIPPWDELSAIMAALGLNYQMAAPGERDIDPVTLYFEKIDDPHTHVKFASLSAGEKVLTILAIALLNVHPFRAAVQRPQLLLLDEIDASLHPGVLNEWMRTIQEKVVGDMGIPCVMTTHSPITVALTPDGSLFEMKRNDVPLQQIAKHEALNKLTVGLPSMEVEFTKRRQIFVEADVDAQAYDRLHTLMKAELQLSCSLNFLSTGIVNKAGVEQGTGCSAVEKVVGQLAGYGNLSTFGLLDWDGSREDIDRIHVLGHNSHYAFDNVILNPLLIGALLIRRNSPPAENLPKFVDIGKYDQSLLQNIANSVQSKIAYPAGASTGQTQTHFHCGIEILTHEAFCLSNGHKIEEAIKAAFPSLKAFSQRGKLALAVIEGIISDYPGLCPKPIVEAFQKLANATPAP
ncbi:AAA family ATPase [Brucella sp. NBRC 12950]|uniref:AAA family ATPase n=1 Tax=Brucella sp. NBRC 12950 TaxID=2994518 RepID=UPI0024A4DE6B|nr:AAA family ATPase [Brucella sp. NBRC 12950]GLU29859.1 hypothetical protein Brsp01_50920 [Brucella sp. NBRC 12950]